MMRVNLKIRQAFHKEYLKEVEMKITGLTLRLDLQKAVLELLIEKGVITGEEIRKKVIEYNSLTEEELDEILVSLNKKDK